MVGVYSVCDDGEHPALAADGEFIIGANSAALKLFRVQPEEIIGTHVSHWIDSDFKDLVHLRIKILKEHRRVGESLPEITYKFVRRDATRFWADLRVQWETEHIACGRFYHVTEADDDDWRLKYGIKIVW